MRRLITTIVLFILTAAPAASQSGLAVGISFGPNLPTTCSVGEPFYLNQGAVNLYFCTDKNPPVTWTPVGAGAPIDATYITQIANGTLTAEQVLGVLATGLLKVTTTSGVLSTAVAPTDYVATSDSRLSDARTPTAHNQAESTITFTDITASKTLEAQLRTKQAMLENHVAAQAAGLKRRQGRSKP